MNLTKYILIKLIKLYKIFISPYLGNNCRYLPTCSEYFIDSLNEHGVFRGVFNDETKEKFSHLKEGEVILIENIRYFKEETEDDEGFSQKIASLGDVYINDAFSCSHRKQASVHNITKYIKKNYAGPLLKKEITVKIE